MEYFNTFGGNPVSCAVGLEVLAVIDREGLQENARRVGELLLEALRTLAGRYSLIGEVRGRGLFLGIELVRGDDRTEPAAREAVDVVEQMKEAGYLLSTDGPDHNVLKIKPPLVITAEDAQAFLGALARTLEDYSLSAAGSTDGTG